MSRGRRQAILVALLGAAGLGVSGLLWYFVFRSPAAPAPVQSQAPQLPVKPEGGGQDERNRETWIAPEYRAKLLRDAGMRHGRHDAGPHGLSAEVNPSAPEPSPSVTPGPLPADSERVDRVLSPLRSAVRDCFGDDAPVGIELAFGIDADGAIDARSLAVAVPAGIVAPAPPPPVECIRRAVRTAHFDEDRGHVVVGYRMTLARGR